MRCNNFSMCKISSMTILQFSGWLWFIPNLIFILVNQLPISLVIKLIFLIHNLPSTRLKHTLKLLNSNSPIPRIRCYQPTIMLVYNYTFRRRCVSEFSFMNGYFHHQSIKFQLILAHWRAQWLVLCIIVLGYWEFFGVFD